LIFFGRIKKKINYWLIFLVIYLKKIIFWFTFSDLRRHAYKG